MPNQPGGGRSLLIKGNPTSNEIHRPLKTGPGQKQEIAHAQTFIMDADEPAIKTSGQHNGLTGATN